MNIKKVYSVFSIITLMALVKASLILQKEYMNGSNQNDKGLLDGSIGDQSPSLSGGPKLIFGAFQAVVTKFDPSLVQGIPGLSDLLPVG